MPKYRVVWGDLRYKRADKVFDGLIEARAFAKTVNGKVFQKNRKRKKR